MSVMKDGRESKHNTWVSARGLRLLPGLEMGEVKLKIIYIFNLYELFKNISIEGYKSNPLLKYIFFKKQIDTHTHAAIL